jgi:hypothetical protein
MRGKGTRKRINNIIQAFKDGQSRRGEEEQRPKRSRADRSQTTGAGMVGTKKRRTDVGIGGSVAKKTRTESEVEHVGLSSGEPGDITGDQIIDFQSHLNRTNLIGQTNNEVDHVSTGYGVINKNIDSRSINATKSDINAQPGLSECHDVAACRGVEPIWCAGDDMSVHVPRTLKSQIGRGEYVNLALLLKGAMELNDICKGNTLSLSASGKIEAKPRECRDKVSSIEKWTDAFLIYMSIYIKEHPKKVGEMLQYVSLIREAAVRQGGYSWRVYDEQFRIRQAACPVSWGSLNQDLWLRCMSFKDQTTPQLQMGQQILGTCSYYNQGYCYWPKCKYQHKCSNCGQLHPKIKCTAFEHKTQHAEFTQMSPQFHNNEDNNLLFENESEWKTYCDVHNM